MPIFCKYTAWLQTGADSTLGHVIRRQQIEQQLFIGSHNETLSVAAIMVSLVRSIVDTSRPFQFQKSSQLFIRVHDVRL